GAPVALQPVRRSDRPLPSVQCRHAEGRRPARPDALAPAIPGFGRPDGFRGEPSLPPSVDANGGADPDMGPVDGAAVPVDRSVACVQGREVGAGGVASVVETAHSSAPSAVVTLSTTAGAAAISSKSSRVPRASLTKYFARPSSGVTSVN